MSFFSDVLQLYYDKLSEYEKQEIHEYSEVWFVGLECEKLPASSVKDYDDENGAYKKVNKDHIAYRYEIIETLGKGSFGQVLKAAFLCLLSAFALRLHRRWGSA